MSNNKFNLSANFRCCCGVIYHFSLPFHYLKLLKLLFKLWRVYTADDDCVSLPLHKNLRTVMSQNRQVSKVFTASGRISHLAHYRPPTTVCALSKTSVAADMCKKTLPQKCASVSRIAVIVAPTILPPMAAVRCAHSLRELCGITACSGHFGEALFACHFCKLTAVSRLWNFESCSYARPLRGFRCDQNKTMHIGWTKLGKHFQLIIGV